MASTSTRRGRAQTIIQTNFSAGEVSPYLFGRTDLKNYFNALETLENMVCKTQGGIVRRSGTAFVKTAKDNSKKSRLVPFEFSNIQAYMLEFCDNQIRVMRDGGVVQPDNVAELTQASAFDHADWAKNNVTISANADDDHLGATIVDEIVETGVGGLHAISQENIGTAILTLGKTYTMSAKVKRGTGTRNAQLYVRNHDNTICTANFDLSDGTVNGSPANSTATVQKTPFLSYYCIKMHFSAGASYANHVDVELRMLKDDFSYSYTGAGSSSIKAYDVRISEGEDSEIVAVTSTYTEAELPFISFTQSADVLFIAHTNHAPAEFSRTSHTDWTLTDSVFEDGPYLDENITDTTVYISAVTYRKDLTTTGNWTGFGTGDYVEYIVGEDYALGKWVSVSEPVATVEAIDNVWTTLDPTAAYTFSAGTPDTLVSDKSVFTNSMDGHYIRYQTTPGGGVWTWSLVSKFVDEKNLEISAAPLTMHTPPANITVSNETYLATIISTDAIFASTDVADNRVIRMNFGGEQVWGKIVTFSSTTQINANLTRFVPLDPYDPSIFKFSGRTQKWRLGAWKDANWPGSVVFHQNRLTFGGSVDNPDTVWMSNSAEYRNFSPTETNSTVLDTNAITVTIAAQEVNTIQWMSSGPILIIGTLAAEWEIKGTSVSAPLTPASIRISEHTNFGSEKVAPVKIDSSILFVQRAGTKLREFKYNFDIDAYVADDLTILAEHIIRDGTNVESIAVQRSPETLIWIARNDGVLVGLTYNRSQEITAFHRHKIGGSFSTGDAVVEGVAACPSGTGQDDDVYVVVKRTINSETVRYIEVIQNEFIPTGVQDKNNMRYVDSSLTYNGAAVLSIAGLGHLPGESVRVVSDGEDIGDLTVSATTGKITLPETGSVVHVGYHKASTIKPMPYEVEDSLGSTSGRLKRVHRLTLRLINTLGFKHGKSTTDLVQEDFRDTSPAHDMDKTPDLFTGDREINLNVNSDVRDTFVIVQEQAYPIGILSIISQITSQR